MLASPYVVLGLVPAILLEWPFLWRMLALAPARALWVSAAANLVSTLAGIALGVATMFLSAMEDGREFVLGALVVLFLLSWWIEKAMARAMHPTPQGRPFALALFLANLASYSALAAAAVVFEEPYEARFNLRTRAQVMNALHAASREAESAFHETGRFPAGERPTSTDRLRRLTVEPDGRVVAVLNMPASRELDGKRIVLEPRVVERRVAEWTCRSPDIAARHLPGRCRGVGAK